MAYPTSNVPCTAQACDKQHAKRPLYGSLLVTRSRGTSLERTSRCDTGHNVSPLNGPVGVMQSHCRSHQRLADVTMAQCEPLHGLECADKLQGACLLLSPSRAEPRLDDYATAGRELANASRAVRWTNRARVRACTTGATRTTHHSFGLGLWPLAMDGRRDRTGT